MEYNEVTKPYRGVIENWRVVDWCYSTGQKVVSGFLFGDDRYEDGTSIRTSEVVKLDYENKKLETLNSMYDLGKECK